MRLLRIGAYTNRCIHAAATTTTSTSTRSTPGRVQSPGLTARRSITGASDASKRAAQDGGREGTRAMDADASLRGVTTAATELTDLSPADLIARINVLEERLRGATTARLAVLTTADDKSERRSADADAGEAQTPAKSTKTRKAAKPIDFSRYKTRHVAFKFAYLGQRYNGLEHTNGGPAPLKPTIEEALWKALRKVRLIPPDVPEGCDGTFEPVFYERERRSMYWEKKVRLEIDWSGLAYSKCGRTDKGVSAFGQVIGVRVRSNQPKEKERLDDGEHEGEKDLFDHVKDELPYISMLNGVLPADIRILAWCPNPGASFDARFSCRERKYKYFFTNPAFCPTPGPLGLSHANGEPAPFREGWLDVDAMREAAKKLEGLHDYRNFCKIDASKQMSSCERRITFADIEEMPGGVGLNQFHADPRLNLRGDSLTMANGSTGVTATQGPKVYAFAVHGTAFLWHQVRCMVAILFLVGQGLEKPEVVDDLLDVLKNPRRPHYEMGDDAPLVLWDCTFPGDEPGDEDGVKWVYAGDDVGTSAVVKKGDSQHDGKFGFGGLVSDVWTEWREAKMKETITAGLLSLSLNQGDGTSLDRSGFRSGISPKYRSQRVFDGGDSSRNVGDYVPVMQKPKMETLEVQNAKYLAGKQARRDIKKLQTLEG